MTVLKNYKKEFNSVILFVFFVFLIQKLFVSGIAYYSYLNAFEPPLDLTNEFIQKNYTNQNLSAVDEFFISPWFRWDTIHYLEIAIFGYDFDSINTVWPPLYPFLIKIITLLTNNPLKSAIFISNFFTVSSYFLLYYLTKTYFNKTIAQKTIIFLSLFPSSFFLIAGYTESLFLFLSLVVFFAIRDKKWELAGIACALATLTRVQGLFLLLPIIVAAIQTYKKDSARNILKFVPALSLGPLCYGLFSIYVRFGLQEKWPWVTLSEEWHQHLGFPWEGFIGNISVLLGKIVENDVTHNFVKVFHMLFILWAIYWVLKIWNKLPYPISLYSIVLILLYLGKVDNNSIMVSTIRYVLVIFPVFIGNAYFLKNKYLVAFLILIFIAIQTLFISMFVRWIWVA